MRRHRAVVVGFLGLGMVAIACGPETHRPSFHKYDDDMPEFSATRLGDPLERDSVADFLAPDERAAATRAGIPRDEAERVDNRVPDDELQPGESKADQWGHGAMAALGVSISVFMAVAPYLLF